MTGRHSADGWSNLARALRKRDEDGQLTANAIFIRCALFAAALYVLALLIYLI